MGVFPPVPSLGDGAGSRSGILRRSQSPVKEIESPGVVAPPRLAHYSGGRRQRVNSIPMPADPRAPAPCRGVHPMQARSIPIRGQFCLSATSCRRRSECPRIEEFRRLDR